MRPSGRDRECSSISYEATEAVLDSGWATTRVGMGDHKGRPYALSPTSRSDKRSARRNRNKDG